MYKAKFRYFAMVCTLVFVTLSPISTFAAETSTDSSVTQSEIKESKKDKKAAFEEKMKKANENWNSLTDKQKDEIYSLLEKEMQDEMNVIDKLAELHVMEKEDAVMIKAHMLEKFDKVKESGEFPLFKHRGNKRSK